MPLFVVLFFLLRPIVACYLFKIYLCLKKFIYSDRFIPISYIYKEYYNVVLISFLVSAK